MNNSEQTRTLTGWISFSIVLLLFLGIFNIIDGIAALSKDDFFAAEELLFGSLSTWGWIMLVLGSFQVGTAYLVYQKRTIGLAMAVLWGFFSGMVHFLTVGAYPLWSITAMVLSFMIMLALLTNSDEFS